METKKDHEAELIKVMNLEIENGPHENVKEVISFQKERAPSDFQLFMMTVKLFFGISYLSMPNTFAHCGIIGGNLLFTIVIGMNGITMLQLLSVSENYHNVQSYSDLGLKVLGQNSKNLLDGCILVKQICGSISYLFFVSKQLEFVFCHLTDDACYSNQVFIMILIIPVIIMSTADSYKYMSYFAIPAILLACTGMICIFFFSFS